MSLGKRATRLAAGVVGILLLLTLLGDLLASHAPIVMGDSDGVHLLPRWTASERVADKLPSEIRRDLGSEGWAIWPPVVAAPLTVTQAAPARAEPASARGAAVLVSWLRATQTSVALAALIVGLALSLGVLLGALAALGPPLADTVLARSVELVSLLPTILGVAVLQSIEPTPTLVPLVAVLALTQATEIARLVRVHALHLSGSAFEDASRSLGASAEHLLRFELLPHLAPALRAACLVSVTSTVGVEATLSYLGLAQVQGHSSWGSVLGGASAPHDSTLLWATLASVLTSMLALQVLSAASDADAQPPSHL